MVLGVSSTFVVPGDEHKKGVKTPIAAYFTFTYSTVKREEIPTDKNFPPYELPVFLLARLAVDKTHARKGLGEKVLVRALRYAIELQERGLPGVAVVLDVLDEDALGFYEKFDFLPFHDNPMRLYMPMKTVLQLK
jgi:predicted N-acetyltransferase YhbS